MGEFWLRLMGGVAPAIVVAALICVRFAAAQTQRSAAVSTRPQVAPVDDSAANVLTTAEWERVDGAVKRALAWLASQQQPDGSFPTLDMGQPGVTCLATMAFMAHGHVPGKGPYGIRLEKA